MKVRSKGHIFNFMLQTEKLFAMSIKYESEQNISKWIVYKL